MPSSSPLDGSLQLRPPLLLLKTPLRDVPAYTTAGFIGSMATRLAPATSGPLLVQRLTPALAVPAENASAPKPTRARKPVLRFSMVPFMSPPPFLSPFHGTFGRISPAAAGSLSIEMRFFF